MAKRISPAEKYFLVVLAFYYGTASFFLLGFFYDYIPALVTKHLRTITVELFLLLGPVANILCWPDLRWHFFLETLVFFSMILAFVFTKRRGWRFWIAVLASAFWFISATLPVAAVS